jgi:hypothetical protein
MLQATNVNIHATKKKRDISHVPGATVDSLEQRCTSRAHRTVCEDVCSSACTRAYDATARPGM